MAAKHILAGLAAVLFFAALWRLAHDGFKLSPSSRTWLTVALVFAAVSAWLWWTQAQR